MPLTPPESIRLRELLGNLDEQITISADGLYPTSEISDRVDTLYDAIYDVSDPKWDRPPKSLEDLCALFAESAKLTGLNVLSSGHGGYAGGEFFNIEIRFPDGFEAFTEIRESVDSEYQDRYYGRFLNPKRTLLFRFWSDPEETDGVRKRMAVWKAPDLGKLTYVVTHRGEDVTKSALISFAMREAGCDTEAIGELLSWVLTHKRGEDLR